LASSELFRDEDDAERAVQARLGAINKAKAMFLPGRCYRLVLAATSPRMIVWSWNICAWLHSLQQPTLIMARADDPISAH